MVTSQEQMKHSLTKGSVLSGHLKVVLDILKQNQLVINKKKCTFGQLKLEYLGLIISSEGVQADPSKIDSMISWPSPRDIKSLRGFLGLTGYYRKFVKDYDAFSWGERAQQAFEALKLAMTQVPLNAFFQSETMFGQRVMDENQQKWVSKFMGYKFEIKYKPGVENRLADALSRRGESSELYAFSIWQYKDKEEWDQEVQRDTKMTSILQKSIQDNNQMTTTAEEWMSTI
ncbi:hypothetical protein KY289_015205 [Solanum tuberosum]|nr:hypothetical protein KY289_015205 [Solanum tuberosum]